MVIVPHPPYSPDLAPCDFALFHKVRMELKRRRFGTVSDIQRESKRYWAALREMTSTVLSQDFFLGPVRELSDNIQQRFDCNLNKIPNSTTAVISAEVFEEICSFSLRHEMIYSFFVIRVRHEIITNSY
jgi:hypothetical protein